MRTVRVRVLVRLLVVAAAALLVTVVFDPAAGLASTQPGFSTQPRVVDHPPADSGKLITLRAGRTARVLAATTYSRHLTSGRTPGGQA